MEQRLTLVKKTFEYLPLIFMKFHCFRMFNSTAFTNFDLLTKQNLSIADEMLKYCQDQGLDPLQTIPKMQHAAKQRCYYRFQLLNPGRRSNFKAKAKARLVLSYLCESQGKPKGNPRAEQHCSCQAKVSAEHKIWFSVTLMSNKLFSGCRRTGRERNRLGSKIWRMLPLHSWSCTDS